MNGRWCSISETGQSFQMIIRGHMDCSGNCCSSVCHGPSSSLLQALPNPVQQLLPHKDLCITS